MASSTISSSIGKSITLGSQGYTSPLTITDTGTITGSGPLAALYIPFSLNLGVVRNAGTIIGTQDGAGISSGIYAVGSSRIFNSGSIIGGEGNASEASSNGPGVVLLYGGMLTNTGAITGGDAASGFGGIGVEIEPGSKVNNSGTIAGGAGTQAGRGVKDISGTLTNSGTILGGFSTIGYGGYGVLITGSGARGSNSGQIIGGNGQIYTPEQNGAGLYATNGAMFTNTGTISAGIQAIGAIISGATLINKGLIQAGYNRGTPRSVNFYVDVTGIYFKSGKLLNEGTILGGSSGEDARGYNDNGGAGVFAEADFTNRGLIVGGTGGDGSGYGGAGVQIVGSLMNFGTISGGHGANDYHFGYEYTGGQGSDGVKLESNSSFTNHGLVTGGAGGVGGYYYDGAPYHRAPAGGNGVDARDGFNRVVNTGTILGGTGGGGGYGGAGSAGVLLGGTMVNSGVVRGGAGGIGYNYDGNGASGVVLFTGARLQNTGTIMGGTGEISGDGVEDFSGTLVNAGTIRGGLGKAKNLGGYGVFVTGSGAKGGNTGRIIGGNGLSKGSASGNLYSGIGLDAADGAIFINNGTISGGSLGIGARISGGTLINHGLVKGGKGGEAGLFPNDQVNLAGVAFASGELLNTGTIRGGNVAHFMLDDYNNGGTGVVANASFTNRGLVAGGSGGNYQGDGGYGVEIGRQGVTNFGTISGGHGADYGTYGYSGGAGGFGVKMAADTSLTNLGVIIGGTGGSGSHYLPGVGYSPPNPGGAGVDTTGGTTGGDTLVNKGTILGGQGGRGGGFGGSGQPGVELFGGSLDNSGVIIGGKGGYGEYSFGAGGNGVVIAAGATLRNTGTIIGGAGATGGGSGAYETSGVLINAGLISGGANIGAYGRGIAVSLHAKSTLIVENGGSFKGLVVASPGGGDTLEVAGKSSATLAGIGTAFTGFATIAFADNAAWTISGDSAGLAAKQAITGFTSKDAIVLSDAAADGTVTVAAAGVVTIDAGGVKYNLDISGATIGEDNFNFADHTLTETKGAEMPFLAPAVSASLPDLAAVFTPSVQPDAAIGRAGPAITFSAFSLASLAGSMQDLLRPQQNAIVPAVTLHA